MEEAYTYTYILKCPKSGEVRYVGKSNRPRQRLSAHTRTDKTACPHKVNWVQSLIKEGLLPELEIIKKVAKDKWKRWEKYYIRRYREEGARLTNCTDGGDGSTFGNSGSFKKGGNYLGPPAAKGSCLVCGTEYLASPSHQKKKKFCSSKCRKAHLLIEPHPGCFKKGHTAYKNRVYEKNKGNSQKIVQLNKDTLEVVSYYPSSAEASRQTGLSRQAILACINKYNKTSGGYLWKKEEDYE